MLIHFLSQLGLWSWFVLGLVLLILEIMAPGFFFIWFGLAALVTGGLAFLLGSIIGFGWQVQTVLFWFSPLHSCWRAGAFRLQ